MNYLKIILIFTKIAFITISLLIKFYFNKKSVTTLKHHWAKSCLKILGYNIKIIGENPKKNEFDKPVIYVGNHISFLDILVLMSAEPRLVFLSKFEVSQWPIIGFAAKAVGTLFVKRNSARDRAKALQTTALLLNEHKAHLAVFPSGTTTLEEHLVWKKGLFKVASENNIEVVLFKINYTPLRESAYIDDDSILSQLLSQQKILKKTCTLNWLTCQTIQHPEQDAENLRFKVVNFKC